MSSKQFVGIVVLAAFFILGTSMFIQMMGTAESGVDMSGSDYETQYESTSELNQLAVSFTKFFPILFGVLALGVVLMWLNKIAKKMY